MNTTMDERYINTVKAILLSANARTLKKAVLSKPDDKSIVRAVLTQRLISGRPALQEELFMADNKALHRNYFLSEDPIDELCHRAEGFAQINVITSSGECELRRSKGGKITVKGLGKITATGTAEPLPEDNNRKKTYILDGSEEFLKLLEVSDKNGRVYDKKQSKFRQINRFLEHIRDICKHLPAEGELYILDLCCGKSYLSFAVYHYFARVLKRDVVMHGVDLKPDVIAYCSEVAKKLGFSGLTFTCGDINDFVAASHPHLVVSLHACDVATDIVIDKAISTEADVILSTPCCHHELNHKMDCPTLAFISDYSMLRQKLCDAATDALRLKRMEMNGYTVDALELIDPEDTPKNVLLRGIRKKGFDKSSQKAKRLCEEYAELRRFLYGKNA